MKKRLTLPLIPYLIIISCLGCNKSEYHKLSYVNIYQKRSVFYFEDGRVFVAHLQDNPHLKNIAPEELQAVKYVLFGRNGEMLLEGTQEEGVFVSKGRIPLRVQQIK
jgi:hypothetical protein